MSEDRRLEGMQTIKTCDALMDGVNKRLDKMDIILEKVANRLPLWATFLITGLTGVICVLATGIVEKALGVK